VARSVEGGARLLLGGAVPAGPGAFYPPTVLTGVAKGMPAYEKLLTREQVLEVANYLRSLKP